MLFDKDYTCLISQDTNECTEEVSCPGDPDCPLGAESYQKWVCPTYCSRLTPEEFDVGAADEEDATELCEEAKLDNELAELCRLRGVCSLSN